MKKQVAAHAAEATRRNVPGTPWFFVKVGAAPPKVVRPEAYDGESFSAHPRRRARPVSDRLLRVALVVVSVAGIAVAGYLTYVHYQPAGADLHDRRRLRDGAALEVRRARRRSRSRSSASRRGSRRSCSTLWNSELARTLTAALALAALAFAAYLVILQLFVIDAICVWCMANDVVLVPLFACWRCCGCGRRPRRTSG